MLELRRPFCLKNENKTDHYEAIPMQRICTVEIENQVLLQGKADMKCVITFDRNGCIFFIMSPLPLTKD